MVRINNITKDIPNSKIWKNISRNEYNLSQTKELFLSFPRETTCTTCIIGEDSKGEKRVIHIFKDKLGKSLGSQTDFADGSCILIQIERNLPNIYSSCNHVVNRITRMFVDSDNILREFSTFASVICKISDKESLTKNEPRNFIDKIVVYKNKKIENDTHIDLFQEISNIYNKFDGKFGRKYFNSHSQMNTDTFETKLLNVGHSDDVNIDTTNPYFKTYLMKNIDSLNATYADIAKKHNVLDIKPPLYLKAMDSINKDGSYIAGGTDFDNSGIFVTKTIKGQWRPKSGMVSTLAHECEHAFVQHVKIQLAKLKNLKSDDPDSIKFFDVVESRFKPIDIDSNEYKKAKIYCEEGNNYDELCDKIGHDNLISEKEANIAGELALKEYLACEKNIQDNIETSKTIIDEMNHGHNVWWWIFE